MTFQVSGRLGVSLLFKSLFNPCRIRKRSFSVASSQNDGHAPVLFKEIMAFASSSTTEGDFIDSTAGLGGHSMGLLEILQNRCKFHNKTDRI